MSVIHVHPRPGDRRRGWIEAGPLRAPCALGRGGVSRAKREGDGATPRATLRPLQAFWRMDRTRRPVTTLPMRPLRRSDGWCDDARHPRYNQPVRLPFAAGHERMHRDDGLYDVVVDLDWNRRPAVRGRGSAIFLHLARPGFAPTEGCIAVSAATMRRLMPLLGRHTRIRVH